MENVIRLSGRRGRRTPSEDKALYLRVGRNDHLSMLDLLARGEERFFGLVLEAQNVERQRALLTEAAKRGFDTILETKSQPLALPGGFTPALGALPWGGEVPHRLQDFTGSQGRERAERIVAFALEKGFSSVLAPTHALRDHMDPWFDVDIGMAEAMNQAIRLANVDLGLIYPLCVPIRTLREPAYRRALMQRLESVEAETLWLKVDQFGANASGEKTVAYIEAARELQHLRVPVVADHVGGLPGLALLAFDGVGGIAHGVTLQERFDSTAWRRPMANGGRVLPPRVYFEGIDLHVSKALAQALFTEGSPRLRRLLGCTDVLCCEKGTTSMVSSPSHHFVVRRSKQVAGISQTPPELRAQAYLDDHVRPASDNVYTMLSARNLPDEFRKSLDKKQTTLGRFRHTIGNLLKADEFGAVARAPRRLQDRRLPRSSGGWE